MKWIITKDYINTDPDVVGYCNDDLANSLDVPRISAEQIAQETADMTEEFRLLDADGAPYLSGKCKDLDGQDQDSAFEPLDTFMDMFGVTTMEYRKIGETTWKQL